MIQTKKDIPVTLFTLKGWGADFTHKAFRLTFGHEAHVRGCRIYTHNSVFAIIYGIKMHILEKVNVLRSVRGSKLREGVSDSAQKF